MAENHLPRGDDLAQQENNGFEPLFKRRGKNCYCYFSYHGYDKWRDVILRGER